MLDKMIESKSSRSDEARKGRFFLITMFTVISLILGGWTYSLFGKEFEISESSLDLSRLVAPVAFAAENPPPPAEPKLKVTASSEKPSKKIILRELYEDPNKPTKPPQEVGSQKNIISAAKFDLSRVQRGESDQVPASIGVRGDGLERESGGGLGDKYKPDGDAEESNKPPQLAAAKPNPTPEPVRVVKSEGVVNGKASYLAQPPYPPAAKNLRIGGAVDVQVTIDEEGRVISARAVSGHRFLRTVSEQAARASRFTPTLLSKQPVKVTGIIVYQFKVD